jgi:hypothetical protein
VQVAGIKAAYMAKPRHVRDRHDPVSGRDQAIATEVLHRAVDLDGRQRERIGNLLLRQRESETARVLVLGIEANAEFAEQMRKPFFRRSPRCQFTV